jgi:peptide/nickel transport system substrate-binding protein
MRPHEPIAVRAAALVASIVVLIGTARCGSAAGPQAHPTNDTTFRVGVGGMPYQTPERGVQQFASNISNEGLLRVDQEGRPEPWLAESWRMSPDGLLLTIHLRRNVTFQDGSPVEAQTVVDVLKANLPKALPSSSEDVDTITVDKENEISVRFRHPSSFVAEALSDVPIQKPVSGIGTGPYTITTAYTAATNSAEMTANSRYYLGRPVIDTISIKTYPNVRAAWAEMLRDRLDMLYEVGVDAIDSMRGASSIALYTFDRPYQYMVLLNPRVPKLRSAEIRRALNQAIDRPALVRDGLAGHGTPSVGPVSAHHWAFQGAGPTFVYAPQSSATTIAHLSKPTGQRSNGERFTLKCLAPAGAPYEHLALIVKQQLAAVGVDLAVEEIPPDRWVPIVASHDFEAALVDAASGWSVFRPSRWAHSQGPGNLTGFSSPAVDRALDQVRHSANDESYRAGIAAFQRAISDDPPAIFLAWGDRSRAVLSRFDVQPQPSRDVLSTLRLWRPSTDNRKAGPN